MVSSQNKRTAGSSFEFVFTEREGMLVLRKCCFAPENEDVPGKPFLFALWPHYKKKKKKKKNPQQALCNLAERVIRVSSRPLPSWNLDFSMFNGKLLSS